MLSSANKLVEGGAELLVCPDNTVHQRSTLSVTSCRYHGCILLKRSQRLSKTNFTRLAILGTRYLMEGPVYPSKLAPLGIEYQIPDPVDRERINGIIFDELVYGELKEGSRRYFQDVIRSLGPYGCDAVVLGCTEIPLLIKETGSPLPAIDSTRTLARAGSPGGNSKRVFLIIGRTKIGTLSSIPLFTM